MRWGIKMTSVAPTGDFGLSFSPSVEMKSALWVAYLGKSLVIFSNASAHARRERSAFKSQLSHSTSQSQGLSCGLWWSEPEYSWLAGLRASSLLYHQLPSLNRNSGVTDEGFCTIYPGIWGVELRSSGSDKQVYFFNLLGHFVPSSFLVT